MQRASLSLSLADVILSFSWRARACRRFIFVDQQKAGYILVDRHRALNNAREGRGLFFSRRVLSCA